MLNDDQKNFAQEVAQAMEEWVNNTPDEEKDKLPGLPLSNWDIKSFPVIYEREVFADKNKKTGISRQMNVIVHMATDSNPYHSDPRAYASPDHTNFNEGRMLVCVQKWTQGSKIKYTVPRGLVGVVEHELVHVFDPKFDPSTVPPEEKEKWMVQQTFGTLGHQRDRRGNIEYGQTPWEQDAGMYERARKRVGNLKQRGEKLSGQIVPMDDWEEAWKTRPEQWKKYLNTLYQVARQEGLA